MQLVDLLLNENLKIIDSTEYSFDHLDRKSSAVAAHLYNEGLDSTSRIAIKFKNGVDFVAAFLGVMKLGATALLFNPKWQLDIESTIYYDYLLTNIRDIPDSDFISNANAEKFVLYTSGSSGKPKAVSVDIERHRRLIEKRSKSVPSKLVKLICSPLCHMSALSNLETSLAAGQTVVIIEKFDPLLVEESILKHKVNQLHLIPSTMRAFIEHANVKFHSVYSVLLGAEAVDNELYDKISSVFPNTRISTAYGSTELGPNVFGNHPDGLPTPKTSVGYPNPDIEYRIVEGVLEVKSPYMLAGYENTEQRFTADGFFITGDLFSVDEQGFYYCYGSAGNVFKSNGNKIYPEKIESILKSHPKIKDAAVIKQPDRIRGFIPVACLIADDTDQSNIETFCQSNLLPYEVPRKFLFLEKLPLNNTNKLNRSELECLIKQQLSQEETDKSLEL